MAAKNVPKVQRDDDLQALFVNESAWVKLTAYCVKPVLKFLTCAVTAVVAALGHWGFHLY